VAASFPRIESALGGVPLAAANEQALNTLIEGGVREDTDIEFKGELYGNSDADKRDLAGDVVAMSNALGGVIFLGVQAVGGVADTLTPVSLDETEELRIRQIMASLAAPPVDFEIMRVNSTHSGQGFHLLVIPQSPSRPHAVRVNKALRYPLRDGAHTRYLAEK
jgi:predicted HTH transcriptional regulator